MTHTKRTHRTGTAGLEIANADKLTKDVSEVGIGVITVLAALIGIWGAACLMGAVANAGMPEMIQGFLTAVTGR